MTRLGLLLRAALLCGALSLSVAAPGRAEDELRELWTGRLYTSTYRAGVCVRPDGDLRGVLLLRLASGAVDVYHFQGRMENGDITARHSSGHKFQGRFADENAVVGKIVLKSGRRVDLRGRRVRGTILSTDTCRPLDHEPK